MHNIQFLKKRVHIFFVAPILFEFLKTRFYCSALIRPWPVTIGHCHFWGNLSAFNIIINLGPIVKINFRGRAHPPVEKNLMLTTPVSSNLFHGEKLRWNWAPLGLERLVTKQAPVTNISVNIQIYYIYKYINTPKICTLLAWVASENFCFQRRVKTGSAENRITIFSIFISKKNKTCSYLQQIKPLLPS